MERMAWSDERMDDFAAHTYRRFDAVDKRFEAVDRRFDKVDGELRGMQAEMNRRFDAMQMEMARRFDSLQRLMLQSSVAVIVALIALIATQV